MSGFLSKLGTSFESRQDLSGVFIDKIIDGFIAFVFQKLPAITIAFSILYLIYNIVAPAVIIIK